MIGQRYREKKTAILDIYKRYLRGTAEDGVLPDCLAQRAKALEEGRFILAVVGETKAGKSTLINALLGDRIVPTDILQSSSAIIEIFKSDRKFVEVKYADGRPEKVYDNLFEHMRQIGAIQDRFRSIPTTLIDDWIVLGRIEAGQPIPVDELQAASKLPLSGKGTLIEEYVKERLLEKIPVEIKLGFPLKYGFDEFILVDSPGVNAIGGFQDRTFGYLLKANAVLFVHSIEGPVEQSSFREFVTDVVPAHTREALFLVLSKSGSCSSNIAIKRKLNEARSLFNQEFDPQRVLHVDSMLKMVSDDILQFDSPMALKEHYRERAHHFNKLYEDEPLQEWAEEVDSYNVKLKLLNNILESVGNCADRDIVRVHLTRASNFDELEREIEKFAMRAPELQLAELLDSIRRGYENQVSDLNQVIDLLGKEKKRKDPQTFENEISKIKDILAEYQLSMHQFVEEIAQGYIGVGSSYRRILEQLKSKYHELIDETSTENILKKVLVDFQEDNCKFLDGVAFKIRGEFEEELRKKGKQFEVKHSVTVPSVDIASLESVALAKAYCKVDIKRDPQGLWEWTQKIFTLGMKDFRGKTTIFDPDRYLANLKSGAKEAVDSTLSKDPSHIGSLLEIFSTSFRQSLASLIDARKKALDDILQQKSTNEKILAEIEASEQKKKAILEELSHINEKLEDLR